MDNKKMPLSAVLAALFERAEKLPDEEKKIIIDLIDKYCIACAMGKLFVDSSKNLFGMTRVTSTIDKVIDSQK